MDFIATAYSFLIPFLLLLFRILKKDWKIYLPGLIAVGNITLLFYSVFTLRQLYTFYLFVQEFGNPGRSLNGPPGWFEIRVALIIIVPFFFLFKAFSANKWLTLGMFVLLNWTRGELFFSFYRHSLFPLNIDYDPYLPVKILNYLCLLMSGYALLWLVKRLPHQQVK